MARLERLLCAALRAHLAGARPRPPEGSAAIWNAFMALSSARTWHMAGPNPIQPSEVEAWCRLMRLPLAPRHVACLLAMDRVWLEHVHARAQQAPEGVRTLPPVSDQPISAALLDALLG